ncbi:MAG TPA: bifunctional tetrahydrofolate synthase/dihydrofolate synthase [Steroidobacteraceae bacterium]|nr:bifunctional tetrahydrofolate synthase/dihydrofolate synthase [Steroidobacteraceae bacterium]
MPAGPRFDRLDDWLAWQQQLHPSAIELGLERVGRVLARTGWRRPDVPVVTVGGTNGKGSTVALLDALLRAAGHRVGTFTSPHLVDYRERIRMDGVKAGATALVAAFERIADALGPDSLTYFEFNTLAALLLFERADLDALVLEVGLGGRLDAVNVVDADVAIVASVGLDHMDYLGTDEESIGREKAGIFRGGRPAIYGATDPPRSVRAEAARIGAELFVRGERFDGRLRDHDDRWDFVIDGATLQHALPRPALPGRVQVGNAATALLALTQVADRLPLDRAAIERGLQDVALPGRFQCISDARGFEWVLDVAHNPAAARALADNLRDGPVPGRTLAVCGMLGDKDVAGVVATLRPLVDAWYAATPEGPRAIEARELAGRARDAGVEMRVGGDVASAMQVAAADARAGDRVVVFGSFHTVGPALVALGVPL